MIRGLGGKSSAATVAAEKLAEQEDNGKYCRDRPFTALMGEGGRSRPGMASKQKSIMDHAMDAFGGGASTIM